MAPGRGASPSVERVEPWVQGSVLAALAGGAWIALGLSGGHGLDHAALGSSGSLSAADVGLFLLAWTVMSVAMMLPSVFPLVQVFLTITGGSGALLALLCGGYLGAWAVFGAGALALDLGFHRLVEGAPWIAARPGRLPGVLLLVAGLFQFSPLKYSCLRQCRSPVGFVVSHWRGGPPAFRALRLGVLHGIYCVGCCWALMLVMFAVGGAHLGWMLVLALVMFAEKVAPWGRQVTVVMGVLLSLWGLALLAGMPWLSIPF